MPVYIRKNVSYTPPSLYNIQLEDDNDYILDPDQLRDVLPQPYRMINKILTQILDDAWEIIDSKHQTVLAEAQKIRPPKCEEPDELPLYSNAAALAESLDGKYIFVGLPNGLAVMDAATQAQIHSWSGNHAEITSIKTHSLASEGIFVVTLDDMAISRLFLFAFNHIFFVKALNENAPEATIKTLCHKCEASLHGDYAGFVFENTGSKDTWLEIHKLPLEAWSKEFEPVSNALMKKKEKKQIMEGTEEQSEVSGDEQNDPVSVEEQQRTKALSQSDNQSESLTQSEVIEKLGIKLSPPVLVMKLNPPKKLPLPANTSSSIGSAINKVEMGDCQGLNHILSTAHLESRDAMFNHRHASMLKYIPDEKEETQLSATFHFVNNSRLLQYSLDSHTLDNSPVAVLLWWSGFPHVTTYSLLKPPGKDNEFKPDIVWPFTSSITCSAVSPCSTYLAVGLKNGNIVLWDRQIGLQKGVLSVSAKCAVKTIRFLDPYLFPLDPPHYPPYPVSSATFILAESEDGCQNLFDTCDGSSQIPRVITSIPENDDEIQTLLRTIPGVPELMLYVQKNGLMFIKDIGTGASLCQIDIPIPRTLQTPWEPIFAFGLGGQVLYVKTEGVDVSEDGDTCDLSCVYIYNLKKYTELEQYWNREYKPTALNIFTKHENRLSALMQERLQQQSLRKPRMQERWGQLRNQLDIIQQARTIPVDTLAIPISPNLSATSEPVVFKPPPLLAVI